MHRSFVTLAVLVATMLAISALSGTAHAQVLKNIFHTMKRDSVRNNLWPDAFVPTDRVAVRAPFALMVRNGWERQNLLADQHFKPGTDELNGAGKNKIKWVLTQATSPHRILYLQRTHRPEATARRLENVRQWAARYLPEEAEPPIELSDFDAVGWPAERVNRVQKEFSNSLPSPRLPELPQESRSRF